VGDASEEKSEPRLMLEIDGSEINTKRLFGRNSSHDGKIAV
jgi:hypothetical protein